MPALAQGGSPFDTGFNAIQTLFTGTIASGLLSLRRLEFSGCGQLVDGWNCVGTLGDWKGDPNGGSWIQGCDLEGAA